MDRFAIMGFPHNYIGNWRISAVPRPIRNFAIFPITLALTACATTQPGVEVRTQRVVVETQKPCPGKVPTRPAPLGALPDDANAALAQTLGKLAEYSGPGEYADQASLFFKTCPAAP